LVDLFEDNLVSTMRQFQYGEYYS